jgi:hypothetical protein
MEAILPVTAVTLGLPAQALLTLTLTPPLRPVVNYVPRLHLHRQIKERLHDGRHDESDTRILAVYGSAELCTGAETTNAVRNTGVANE